MSDAVNAGTWYYARGGQQQGPVTDADLRRLAAAGELSPGDLVWQPGMAQWTPAARVPGLLPPAAAPLPRTGGATPPPLPPQQVGYYAPPPYQAPAGPQHDAGMRMLLPVGRSGWAIAAGYLGLLSLAGGFLGPVAIAISLVALHDMRKHPERHGMGRAVTGLVGGGIGTVMLVFVIIAIANS